MTRQVTENQLITLGLSPSLATHAIHEINTALQLPPEQAWATLSQTVLTADYPFTLHRHLFSLIYPDWQTHPETAPAWCPDPATQRTANLTRFMAAQNIAELTDFHRWSVTDSATFWQNVMTELGIVFQKPYSAICSLEQGIESPQWLVDAKLNIAESCFTAAPTAIALRFLDRHQQLCSMTYAELNQLSNRIANSLRQQGFQASDCIAIAMPMTAEAVAIYLGIIKLGAIVVSIADSFSSEEIATRLHITRAKAIFTQDTLHYGTKQLPLYEKVRQADAPLTIVLAAEDTCSLPLRANDLLWEHFLVADTHFTTAACDPMQTCNILFSSGTTATPKAIPWNHTTAIKAASDAYFHHNIQPTDTLAWPTNLGWMMGPWLIYAALINRATIALYTQGPRERAFGQFIQDANVTVLGVVPTLVAAWRDSGCMEKLAWQHINCFASTGECSNADDMLYLMSLAGYKPIIEYCGGTEIGGGYVSSTVIQKNYPSLFSTKVMGLDFAILDEAGHATDSGEVALIPPALGLSVHLLNADHHAIYFDKMPTVEGKTVRRHSDLIKRYANGYFTVLGRSDDTMNLSGIKISSAEIERVLVGTPHITETAAIAVQPERSGPSQLLIYAVATIDLDKNTVKQEMQKRITQQLNPLFKITDVMIVSELPKTASNKIMRRALRDKTTPV